jgi:hypothetical protein
VSDANLERMGEALYNLSDSLRDSGFLDGNNTIRQQRYNEVVRAWHSLAKMHERLLTQTPSSVLSGGDK